MVSGGDPACATCGLLVNQARDGRWLHIEEPGEKDEIHDVETVIPRRAYLFGQQEARQEGTPIEYMRRQTEALEVIAVGVRQIVDILRSPGV